ncbi:unnamed protein product [Linum tenue]|uniref:RRM domain-containing protein n=1 Tax=Linum tenue TaxID=586396 RepID=A0AAV0KV83_9ROSI|nr:unnamed protein product [Linum tenue]
MGDAGGYLRFPGSLDPQAQEFRPRHVISPPPHHHLAVLPPPLHNQFFYPPPPPSYAADGGVGLLGYHPHHFHPFHHNLNVSYHFNHDYLPQPEPSPPPAAAPPLLTPTRAILLSSLPTDGGVVSETLIRRELEVFGDVRGVQMERIRDGFATVHFYDIRHAEAALTAIRDHRMQYQAGGGGRFITAAARGPFFHLGWGGGVWAQFTIPSIDAVTEGHNQGTIVVFNLDPNASTSQLQQIFQPFGAVKEVRETPLKKQQRFVEFYDVRDAARALSEMNGKEILGRPVVIEFSRPGGFSKKFFNSTANNSAKVIDKDTKYIPLRPTPPPSTRRSFNPRPSSPPRIMVRKNPIVDGFSLGMEGLSMKGGGKKLSHSRVGLQQQKSGGGSGSGNGNGCSRVWKGGKQLMKGNNNRYDSRFLINEEAMVESSSSSSSNWGDSRTTVMIKNIPNKYSQKLLLNMLDNHCIHCNEQIAGDDDGGGEEHNQQPFSSYDFVYLPIDFKLKRSNKCNVGYGFVNMTSPQGAWRLYKAFHHQHWEVFNSKKICEVTYARVQGLEALKEHFKNSKFPSEVEHYLPVVFSPPRDGKQLTDPCPINGGAGDNVQKQNQEEEQNGNGDGLKNSPSAEENDCSGGGDENENSDRDSSSSSS